MATRTTKTATPKATTKPVAKKTTTKTVTAKAVAKPATAPKAVVVETVTPVVSELPLKKPDLVDRVVLQTGMKKKDVKPVVEAMLAVMGDALGKGEEITAPPLGKLMIKKAKDTHNAKVLTLKLRIATNMGGGSKDVPESAAE